MGKKGKKTRWRELPITLADKPYAAVEQPSGRHATDPKPANFAAAAGRRSHHAQHQPYQQHQLPNRNHSTSVSPQNHHVESSTVTFNEDEYTKITTPRQDVLFKKGYLGRRKHNSVPVITEALNENEDGVSIDINPLEELCAHGEYVDPSAMYILSGGGYEIYDPYTGNVTMLMGPPPGHYPPVGHPMLPAMSYQPMPMQPVDWYNSSNATSDWISGGAVYQPNNRHHKRSTTADAQQNGSAQSSEVVSGAQESSLDDQQSLYQSSQPYNMYPGYMFGTPLYNYNGVSIQVPQSQSPPSPSISCDYTNGKRRKKKKRRKRGDVTDEYSDSSSEEQKSQSGASCDLVLDSEKTSDSGVLTNNSGGSTPVNVIPVQLSHSAPPFHMECPPPFEILHGTPILVHHHPDQMATYYQPIPQYAEQLAPIGYQVIPEEQVESAEINDDQPDAEPAPSYSAENSDSGISSPNSEVMVKSSADNKHEKPQAVNGNSGQPVTKKSRNKKSKQREKTTTESIIKTKSKDLPKNQHEGSKKSSKIAKEPAIIKKLNAKKNKSRSEHEKLETTKPLKEEQSKPEIENISEEIIQLSISPEAEWIQEEEFCSLECTPRSTTDNIQFQFTKTQSLDSCESVEEETFATAVNTGNSDTENEIRQDEVGKQELASPINAAIPGPITEAVTKWLNDQGGLMLSPCLDDSGTDDGELSEYDDFEEHLSTTSPKNVQGNPYPALSRSDGSRVAGSSSHDQRQSGLISSGICCLTQ
ncbi:uncharacterized protein LOC132923375 [Rhopalosiphum padi]|uniref:uncharacterized protein LOC132923375 n=1 Tax=Rhopalosiphum padi TaxID=40932 RepID=UPI00298DA724|nr:uncharacterized protein LOC132923375 [Rhopalosiphum padi]XP_060843328.1 uncharacterized protein LOC132923375 [Rhopalosiphum padi]